MEFKDGVRYFMKTSAAVEQFGQNLKIIDIKSETNEWNKSHSCVKVGIKHKQQKCREWEDHAELKVCFYNRSEK